MVHAQDLQWCASVQMNVSHTTVKSKLKDYILYSSSNEIQLKSKIRFGKSYRWNKAAFKREQVSNEHSSNQEEDDLRKWVQVNRAYVDWYEF